jgi:nitrite reductase/ring-hydroxylating ferredoxin subunit
VKLFELADVSPFGSLRFPLPQGEGFAMHDRSGAVRVYVNICPHRAQPVDVGNGRLWLLSGEIECHAHGARFDPQSGNCTGGPCDGRALTPLSIFERDGAAWLASGE